MSCSNCAGREATVAVGAAYDKANLACDLAIYAVTDSSWLDGRALEDVVAQAIAGGATFVQLREKCCSHEQRCALARRVLAVCRTAGVPFIIDDDVECAYEVGADGVHVGQSDTACAAARALLGPDAIVGVSVQTAEQARSAVEAGADYLGVGAVFSTGTKADAVLVGVAGLADICASSSLPVVAIGGITAENAGGLADTGASGVAVVSAIFASSDPAQATRELKASVDAWGRR